MIKQSTVKKLLRHIIYAGLAALVLTPLVGPPVVGGSLYFPYVTGKAFYFRVLVEIVFGAWLVLALFDERLRPKLSWLLAAVWAFVGIALITALAGVNISDSIWSNFERMIGWITLLHVGMLFVVAGHTLQTKHWHWLWYLSLAVSVAVGIIGLAEVGTGEQIDATLGNSLYLGVYSLWHAFLAGFYAVRRIKERLQTDASVFSDWAVYLFTAAGVFHVIVLAFSGARGAALGLAVGIFTTALLVSILQRNRVWLRRAAYVGVLLPLIVGGLVFGFRDSEFVQNQPVVGDFASMSLEYGSAGARLDLWQIGLKGYTKNVNTVMTGWGMDNYNYVFNEFYHPHMDDDAPWYDHPHNVLVGWLVAAGPFGVLAYLSLLGTVVWLIWRRLERGEGWSVLEKSILTGLVVAYLVQNLFVFDHQVSYLLLALMLAWLHARTAEQPIQLPTDVGRAGKVVAAFGVGIVTLGGIYTLNWPHFQQARVLAQAEMTKAPAQALQLYKQAIQRDAIGTQEARQALVNRATRVVEKAGQKSQIAQRYFQTARSQIQKQLNNEPADLRHCITYARLLAAYDRFQPAIAQYEKANAMTRSQRRFVLDDLGRMYLAVGETGKALDVYKQIHERKFSYDDARIQYAAAAVFDGQIKKADKILRAGFGTTTVVHDDLISAYRQTGNQTRLLQLLEKKTRKIMEDDQASAQEKVQAYVSLAAAYQQAGRKLEAIQTLKRAKEAFPAAASQLDRLMRRLRSGRSVQ